MLVVAVAAVAAMTLVVTAHAWLVRVYVVDSSSMEPTLAPGDRLVVDLVSGVERGDIVVIHDPGGWVQGGDRATERSENAAAGAALVKRVIALPGEHVWCCATGSRAVVVDGVPLDEPYLHPEDAPSTLAFDVVVPEGSYWLMGDHRSASWDSRAAQAGSGGPVTESFVMGVVRWVP
jgi:signal peptidase I